MSLKDMLKDNFTNVRSLEDLKYVDRRILIVGGSILFVVLGIYYYYLIGVYFPHKQAVRDAAAAKAAKQQAKQTPAIPQVAIVDPNSTVASSGAVQPVVSTQLDDTLANHMDTSTIPQNESITYMNIFDTIYHYFNYINQGNYDSALSYVDRQMVLYNNITPAIFKFYCQNTYFKINDFYIQSISQNDGYYTVRLSIKNKETSTTGFFVDYRLNESDNKFYFAIDELANYAKAANAKQQ